MRNVVRDFSSTLGMAVIGAFGAYGSALAGAAVIVASGGMATPLLAAGLVTGTATGIGVAKLCHERGSFIWANCSHHWYIVLVVRYRYYYCYC